MRLAITAARENKILADADSAREARTLRLLRPTGRLATLCFAVAAAAAAATTSMTSSARADETPQGNPPPSTADPVPRPAAAASADVVPPKDPQRAASVEPTVAQAPDPGRAALESDPIVDGALIAVSLGFAAVLDLVDGTGEVRPQQISPNFDRSQLIGIDRGAISQTIDSNASRYSSYGLYAAVAYSGSIRF